MDMQPQPGQNPENVVVPPDQFHDVIQNALAEELKPESDVQREPDPDQTAANKALVKKWQDAVKKGKEHFRKTFKQMRDDMDFLQGNQWDTEADSKEKYVANIVQRHIQQLVSSLYAKNPKVVCKRRKTMDFTVWDESRSQLLQLQAEMAPKPAGPMIPGQPPPPMMPPQLSPEASNLLMDVQKGILHRKLMDRIAATMEIVFHYQLSEHKPPFKQQMKQLVRRACTCSVAWAKIGYKRFMKQRPEDLEKITDITQQLENIERMISNMVDGETDVQQAEAEQLRLSLKMMQDQSWMIVEEGLVFDFPRSDQIIVDPKCTDIQALTGCNWIAQEFMMSVDDVQEIYQKDLGKNYTAYEDKNQNGVMTIRAMDHTSETKDTDMVCVWEIYNKKDGMVYVVADGYPEFLKEPGEPDLKLDTFWPFFSLCFNKIENDKTIYPPSDVALMRPMQKEYNRCRQGLREQRRANRPKYAVVNGAFDQEDLDKLADHPDNAVFQLKGLAPGQKVEDMIQVIKPAPIDPAVYDTSMIFDDIQRVSGDQEANIGGAQGNVTATESGIAESNRMTSVSSKADDLEDFLNAIMRTAGKVLFLEMDKETVTKIVGQGAVWPQMNPQQAADELLLEIETGSAGRPNRAAEIQNFDRIAPVLLQIPGISPEWLAKQAIKRLDDNLDVTDAIQDSIQSIVAMNAQKQVGTGDPSTDPNQQGGAPQNQKPPGTPKGPVPGSTPPPINGVSPQVARHIPQPANQNQ